MLKLETKHFLTGEELSSAELMHLLEAAEKLRLSRGDAGYKPLQGKTLAMMFDKPSLRTRLSFTVAVQDLGGNAVELLAQQMKNEEPEDAVRVLQGMVHAVMWRTFAQSRLERMAEAARIPVINGLSDSHHPCQALADLLTLLQRFGRLKGLKLAYVGDGNNVLQSLLLLAPAAGVDVHYACPRGFQPDSEIINRAEQRASESGARIRGFATAAEAVSGADAVYTDVWASMGKEGEATARAEAMKDFQLNQTLFEKAAPQAIALHCLPMVRGQEITSEVADHPRSALFQQAENRLHAQKALLIGLMQAEAEKKESIHVV
jgi:ornithine carbamoyltransferase